jgi:hypothetical protein
MKTNKTAESFILPTLQQNSQDDAKWGSGSRNGKDSAIGGYNSRSNK